MEPTSKARFIEFTTVHDTGQMRGQRSDVLEWPYVEGLRLDGDASADHPRGRPVRRGAAEPERRPAASGGAMEIGFKGIKSIVGSASSKATADVMDDQLARSLRLLLERESDTSIIRGTARQPRRGCVALRRARTQMFNGYEDQVASLYKEWIKNYDAQNSPGHRHRVAFAVGPPEADPPRCRSGATRPPDFIRAGALLDRPGQAPRGPSTVVVRNNQIDPSARIHRRRLSARLIDLKKEFVLPGLIDAHVHVFSDDDKMGAAGGDQPRRRGQSADRVDNVRRTLEPGSRPFAISDRMYSVTALRDAILSGLVPGPTIVAAGAGISGPGGHADSRTTPTATPPRCGGAGHQPVQRRRRLPPCAFAIRSPQGADVKIPATGG